VKQAVFSNQLALLSRSHEAQDIYIKFRAQLLKEWRSVSDYVMVCKLGFPELKVTVHQSIVESHSFHSDSASSSVHQTPNTACAAPKNESPEISNLRVLRCADTDNPGPIRTILIPNDFPYNFESDVGHHVLWKVGGSLTPDDIESACQELRVTHNAIDVCRLFFLSRHLVATLRGFRVCA
jgi:hypothetical protein